MRRLRTPVQFNGTASLAIYQGDHSLWRSQTGQLSNQRAVHNAAKQPPRSCLLAAARAYRRY